MWRSDALRATVSFFTTGACNLSCPHCSQAQFREAFSKSEMSLDVVRGVIADVSAHPAEWQAHLTGGEPTMWSVVVSACELLRESGAFVSIRVYSNCVAPRVLDDLLTAGLIDLVYTDLGNCHRNNVRVLAERWGQKRGVSDPDGKVLVAGQERSGHRILPTGPLAGSLPAVCQCPKVSVLPDGKVYPCGNLFSVSRRYGLEIPAEMESHVGQDWITAMAEVSEAKLMMDACRHCSANKHVWETMEDAVR